MGRTSLALVLTATLSVATAYGMLLLLPLQIKHLGGSEATFGVLTALAAVPAAAFLGTLLSFPDRVRPPVLLAVASLAYGGAAAALATVDRLGGLLAVLTIVSGATWSVVYTVGPMVVSERVPDDARAAHIGYLTGTIQLGFGIGPVLGGWLHGRGLSYPGTFAVAAALAATAAGLLVFVRSPGRPAGRVSLVPALANIVRSPARTPLVMILIMACLFTTMTSFQATFAQSRGLSFDVFYVSYTAAVIVARLVVAPFLRDGVLVVATAGIAVALAGFLVVATSPFRYAAASAVLGGAYGLALPAIQARAVNVAPPADRPRMLPLAGLLFQLVILAFPLVAGAVITAFGYQAVFGVLVALAAALLALSRNER
ncbi:MFS transporter [Asanoa sp. NPDC049573]|uniref:MFS transporter n=1 Tax=Asanoa sp. NPDC049573 TaxID=3155396 RepID=UPI00344AE77E